jgi:predicted nuclease with RNAse H fold
MLIIDLNEERYEIVQLITKRCSAFGDVKEIRLSLNSSPVAVVEMSTMKETEELALNLGGKLVGTTAFIELAHRARQVSQAPLELEAVENAIGME